MPQLGLDEQKPDTRPATLGHAAMDADAQWSLGSVDGRSGEARGKDRRLNLGGLPLCTGKETSTKPSSTFAGPPISIRKTPAPTTASPSSFILRPWSSATCKG